MRNRVFKAMCKVPMNLQLFAEDGDGAGAGEGNGGGSGEGTGGEGDNPPSFDDLSEEWETVLRWQTIIRSLPESGQVYLKQL